VPPSLEWLLELLRICINVLSLLEVIFLYSAVTQSSRFVESRLVYLLVLAYLASPEKKTVGQASFCCFYMHTACAIFEFIDIFEHSQISLQGKFQKVIGSCWNYVLLKELVLI